MTKQPFKFNIKWTHIGGKWLTSSCKIRASHTAQISQILKLETKEKSTGTLLVCNLNKCLCHASSTNMDTIVDGLIVYKVANKHCTPSMYILGHYLEIISIA